MTANQEKQPNQEKQLMRPMSWNEYEIAYRKERPNALTVPSPSQWGYGIAYSVTGKMPMVKVKKGEAPHC